MVAYGKILLRRGEEDDFFLTLEEVRSPEEERNYMDLKTGEIGFFVLGEDYLYRVVGIGDFLSYLVLNEEVLDNGLTLGAVDTRLDLRTGDFISVANYNEDRTPYDQLFLVKGFRYRQGIVTQVHVMDLYHFETVSLTVAEFNRHYKKVCRSWAVKKLINPL